MILHRFCSKKEFEAYQRGDMLINNTDHRVKRGNATSSVGFCFFVEDPEEAKAPNTVFEMVFHPNGNLNGSWIEDEDVLLPYAGGSRICYSNRIK